MLLALPYQVGLAQVNPCYLGKYLWFKNSLTINNNSYLCVAEPATPTSPKDKLHIGFMTDYLEWQFERCSK